MKRTRILWTALLALTLFTVPAAGAPTDAATRLKEPLKEGEAYIWYLFHSGWAVKTASRLLIFDYWEGENPPTPEKRSLDTGFIDPAEIAGCKTIVLTSHAHDDHFDPKILEWRKVHRDITFVFGWEYGDGSDIRFGAQREIKDAGGVEIMNIHHAFDGVPESAFLARTDNATIFHAGDHGHGKGPLNAVFKDNTDYLARRAPRPDIMFTPDFGGEMYMFERLKPRVLFPMHDGDNEIQYVKFAKKYAGLGLKCRIATAARRGDCFFYKKGTITPLSR